MYTSNLLFLTNSNRLSLLDCNDRRELFKGSKSSSSNNLDDDNDIDKIFSHYIEKRIMNGVGEFGGGMAGLALNLYQGTEAHSDHEAQPSGSKHRRFFSFMFRSSSNNKSAKSRSSRSSLRSKFKLFSPRSKSSSSKKKKQSTSDTFEMVAPAKKASLNSNFKFDLNNLNLTELEKDFLRVNGANSHGSRRGLGGKSDSIVSNHSIYLDANLVVPNGIKKSKSTLPDFKNEHVNPNSNFIFKNNSHKAMVNVFVDVCIEKLQQNMNGHMLSISLKNLRTEPLIEINHIKAKFNYLSIELVDSKGVEANAIVGTGRQTATQQGHLLAKINKIKSKKCKFDSNLKSFSKPIDFDLVDEHFLNVTEEATNLQIRKVVLKSTAHQSTSDTIDLEENNINGSNTKKQQQSHENQNGAASTANAPIGLTAAALTDAKKTYVFLFSIELHSYLPVSRKILISTFRKKKRIFKGQCQIHENFIHSTQFTKQFLLTEV